MEEERSSAEESAELHDNAGLRGLWEIFQLAWYAGSQF